MYREIEEVILHQTFTSNKNNTFRDLAEEHIRPGEHNFHNPNGCPSICYHYGVNPDGQLFMFNTPTAHTYHCNGEDHRALGIAVLGDFDGITHQGEDGDPDEMQLRGVAKILKHLIIDHEKLTIKQDNVFGHYHFGRENCPGTRIMKLIEDFKQYEFETRTSGDSEESNQENESV